MYVEEKYGKDLFNKGGLKIHTPSIPDAAVPKRPFKGRGRVWKPGEGRERKDAGALLASTSNGYILAHGGADGILRPAIQPATRPKTRVRLQRLFMPLLWTKGFIRRRDVVSLLYTRARQRTPATPEL